MTKSNIKPPGQSNSSPAFIKNSNIVWSSGQKWEGLIIEKHKFARISPSFFKGSDHSLNIRFSLTSAKKDKNKQLDNRLTKICLFSEDSPLRLPCTHHRHEVLLLMLSPELLGRTARELGNILNTKIVEQHQISDAQVEYLGMALKTEAENGYLSGRLYGESLATALSVHLLSKYSIIKSEIINRKGGLTPTNLRRVVEYIDANLTADIGLGNLAKIANLSQFRFAHNFKQATGLAPHQFVIRERLERAKQMLRETDLTVTTIAYAVGCGSPSRFTLLFRRANGVLPSTYRASFR